MVRMLPETTDTRTTFDAVDDPVGENLMQHEITTRLIVRPKNRTSPVTGTSYRATELIAHNKDVD